MFATAPWSKTAGCSRRRRCASRATSSLPSPRSRPRSQTQAVALIEVEYEPLPAVTDIEAALADDAPLVHEDWESYEAPPPLGRDRNRVAYATIVKGDVDAAMAGADVVVKARYVADASHGVPIEPRAIIAQWNGDRVTVWSSTQVPFAARAGVAEVLEIPESKVRVIVPLLGGGFGAKCDFHFEGHVAALARAARPAREARLLAPRGVHRGRPPARGHGHRARDGRSQGRDARRPARSASSSTRARSAVREGSSRSSPRCTCAGPTSSTTSTSSRAASTRTTSRRARSGLRPPPRSAGRSSST